MLEIIQSQNGKFVSNLWYQNNPKKNFKNRRENFLFKKKNPKNVYEVKITTPSKQIFEKRSIYFMEFRKKKLLPWTTAVILFEKKKSITLFVPFYNFEHVMNSSVKWRGKKTINSSRWYDNNNRLALFHFGYCPVLRTRFFPDIFQFFFFFSTAFVKTFLYCAATFARP